MIPARQAASEFLAKKRIAVTAVSRTPKNHGSNVVYQRLRPRGYDVFAINLCSDCTTGWAQGACRPRRPCTADGTASP